MLKDIIEKLKSDIEKLRELDTFLSAMNYDNVIKIIIPYYVNLKKEDELQEEMINALINSTQLLCDLCFENIFSDSDICPNCENKKNMRLIEKYYNKKWENIIK